MTDDKPARSTDDQAIVEEVVRRLAMCLTAESEDNAEAVSDLEHLHGKGQWDEDVRRARAEAGRPCLTINTLPTYLAQVTNDMRQNRISAKVFPVDGKADEETAKVRQGMIRHIEYASRAPSIYAAAGASAAAIGRGYFRLVTEYESDDSFNQEIRVKGIRNPLTVHPDPFRTDFTDARFYIIAEDCPRDEFKAEYPKADAGASLTTEGMGDAFRGWLDGDTVRVAEYYRYADKPQTLHLLADGTTAYEDEMPKGAKSVKKRQSRRRVVEWYKVTAKEVLERREIPCEWIPVFEVVGQEIDINGRVHRKGIIRDAKDSARMYNVMMSAATEEIGSRPKTPWVIAEGQTEGYEEIWERANTSSAAYLPYKPTTVAGVMVPPPMRQSPADVPTGWLAMAMHARDNIKATQGLFDSSMGASGSATSGKQEIAQQKQGQITNFHFSDNLKRVVEYAAKCMLSMMRIYDTERIVRILGDDDEEIGFEEINKPLPVPKLTQDGAVQQVLNDMSYGKYDAITSVGPSYATARQEAAEQMSQLGSSFPKLMDVAGDRIVKAMNWPDADLIADRLKKTLPPGLADGEDGEEQPPQIPPQVQQQLQQYEAALNDAMQQIKQMQESQQGEIERAQLKAQADVEIAKIKALADIEAKVQVASITAEHEAANQPMVEPEEPEEAKPDAVAEALAMVAQAVAMQAAPKRKVMRIQAPSGGVYEGEVIEMAEQAEGMEDGNPA